MIESYPVDVIKNLQLVQEDANRLVPKPKPHIILIQRENSYRIFRPAPLEDLTKSLVSTTGLPVYLYMGRESVIDTIKLFSQANGIVGYHGAGWANSYFTAHPHCAQQISTFYDF